MVVSNPATLARMFFPSTSVFSGAAPTSVQNLDVSAVVGSNRAVALLYVQKTAHTADSYYVFRPDGATTPGTVNGCNYVGTIGGANIGGYCIISTSATGILEWWSNSTDAVNVTVIAYWKV